MTEKKYIYIIDFDKNFFFKSLIYIYNLSNKIYILIKGRHVSIDILDYVLEDGKVFLKLLCYLDKYI